jgi:Flp pilus assembly protein TadG
MNKVTYGQGVFMSSFKYFVLSFWRKDQGLGMVEAAVTLPLLLLIIFGLIEFGNLYVSSYQTRDVADVVGDYLQANPSATPGDLQTFVAGLGLGTLKNTGINQENNIYNNIKIQSTTSPMTASDFDRLCEGSVKNWSNPWPSGSYSLYYIHVCYPYTYGAITPLSKLTGGVLSDTKVIRGKAIATTYPIVTCPAGQFLNNNSGKPVCTQVNASCPVGRYMVRLVGTTPLCAALSIKMQQRYRPDEAKNDCTDAANAVQVGMSPDNKVWCANLTVQ